MTCDDCGGPAKPLFTGTYCVNDCSQEKTPVIGLAFDLDWAAVVPMPSAGSSCLHGKTYSGTQGRVAGTWCVFCGVLLGPPLVP